MDSKKGNNGGKPPILQSKPAVPQPVHRLVLTVFDNKQMAVAGIPQDIKTAIGMLYDANVAIVKHFFEKARAGQLDENDCIIQSKIIEPKKNIII